MEKKHGLAKRFTEIIFISGLCSILLLVVMQLGLNKFLRYYFNQPEAQQSAAQRQVKELQDYINEEGLSVTDTREITDWTRRHRYTLLELYQDHSLVYSSYAPKVYVSREDDTGDRPRTPNYDWMPIYTVEFADGEAQAVLYYNGMDAYYGVGCDILLLLAIVAFPLFFLFGSRKIIRYIVQLSEEIQAMEGGDLDHAITVKGEDELTTLASCLDSMRVTLRSQQQQEAESSAKVKNLITEMSHDLRTPLTTLLLYTEILRSHKYDSEAQMNDYLTKIDTKARQIKQLSDNLFEYALVTRDTVVTLDEPAHFSEIFEEPLTEMVDHLQQRGFVCALELGDDDPILTVKGQYVRRILDNITSNILKYADPENEIVVRSVQEENRVGLSFLNKTLPVPSSAESTKVGLTSMETMMEKMNAVFRVEQSKDWFCVTLLFEVNL